MQAGDIGKGEEAVTDRFRHLLREREIGTYLSQSPNRKINEDSCKKDRQIQGREQSG